MQWLRNWHREVGGGVIVPSVLIGTNEEIEINFLRGLNLNPMKYNFKKQASENQEVSDYHRTCKPHSTRKLSYMKPGIPRLVIEDKWLLKLSIRIGDEVQLKYHKDKVIISFRKK